jgi:hypothetical protein
MSSKVGVELKQQKYDEPFSEYEVKIDISFHHD